MTGAPTHKALFLPAKFAEFKVGDQETPKPGPGQLLLKIEASALNPVDWKIQKYGFFIEEFPAVLGFDVAGVVDQVGEGVTEFAKGDRVLYHAGHAGGFQQYSLADAETTAKIPAKLSFEDAASLPSAVAAAGVGLYAAKPLGAGFVAPLEPSARGKYAGNPLVVLGGASSLGQSIVQFAKLSGFSPIIVTASLKNEAYLKSLGVTHVIDRYIPLSSLPAEIAKVTSAPVETVFDTVSSSETQQAGYDLVADGGHLLVYLPKQFKPTDGKNIESTSVHGTWVVPETRPLGIAINAKLTELLEEGALKPNRVEVLPGGLNAVAGGLERLRANQVSGGKLVVHPQETS